MGIMETFISIRMKLLGAEAPRHTSPKGTQGPPLLMANLHSHNNKKTEPKGACVATSLLQKSSDSDHTLECDVKQGLGSINMNKAGGGDGIPIELFQILKDDAVKVLHSTCHPIWKTQQWPRDWKRSVFILIPKKAMPKNV